MDDELFKVKIPLIREKTDEMEYIGPVALRNIVFEYISQSEGRTRQEINNYIYPILNTDETTMNNRIRTALTYLKRKDKIENLGSDTKSLWKIKK